MSKKIAIILSGPWRYVDKVIDNIDSLIGKDIDYDFFIHLWKEDLGNKKRIEDKYNYERVIFNNHVKNISWEKPNTKEEVSEIYGEWTGCHSTINAMTGMFSSINTTLNVIESIFDRSDYTHVLRIRTDVIFFGKILSKDMLNECIYVSENPLLPKGWISDHIMLAPIEKFKNIWRFSEFDSFIKDFDESERNPEKYLERKIQSLKYDVCINNEHWVRYLDYHIIYNPAKDNDPEFIKNIMMKENGVEKLYAYVLSDADKVEANNIIKYWDRSFKGKVSRRLAKVLRK